MLEQPLILGPLAQALASLDDALAQPKNDYLRDSVIQRFEYTYELAWKAVRRYLMWAGLGGDVDALSRKDLFRAAGQAGLIEDVGAWFEFHKMRNLTSHTYNAQVAEAVYGAARDFAGAARSPLAELERRNA
jgi:nucleotidyltransferase substrate binding protein (TIGR01987 family)